MNSGASNGARRSRPSRVLTALLAIVKSIPGKYGRVRLLSGAAGRMRNPLAATSHGPYRFTYDLSDPFQAGMALGSYEREDIRLLLGCLRPGDTYVDVGAHVGSFAARAAARVGVGGTLLLYEPDPRAYAPLAEHMRPAAGAAAPEIILRNTACSDAEGDLALHLAPILGQSCIENVAHTAAAETVPIRTVTLDGDMARCGVRHVRLMKMDVEGHEFSALRGCREALERRRIDYVLIETNAWLMELMGVRAEHMAAFFLSRGFSAAHVDGRAATRCSIGIEILENLFFARTPALMREAFGRFAPPADIGWTKAEIAALAEEVNIAHHPAIESFHIIRAAERGEMDRAIDQASALLVRRPDLELRGHLAYWLRLAGRRDEALRQYELLCEHFPGNAEAAQTLGALRREIQN